jgi:hypothetical protein
MSSFEVLDVIFGGLKALQSKVNCNFSSKKDTKNFCTRSPSSEPSTSSWEGEEEEGPDDPVLNRFTSPLELVSNALLLRVGFMDWLYFALFALCA